MSIIFGHKNTYQCDSCTNTKLKCKKKKIRGNVTLGYKAKGSWLIIKVADYQRGVGTSYCMN